MNKLIFSCLIVLIMTSCFPNSGGDLKYREAKFNRASDLVIKDLTELKEFENANIKWTVRQFGDSISHNLKIFLKNGKDLPDNDSALYLIGQDAMRIVINSIENEKDYNNFIVYFLTEKKIGLMKYHEEKPFEYKLQDFK